MVQPENPAILASATNIERLSAKTVRLRRGWRVCVAQTSACGARNRSSMRRLERDFLIGSGPAAAITNRHLGATHLADVPVDVGVEQSRFAIFVRRLASQISLTLNLSGGDINCANPAHESRCLYISYVPSICISNHRPDNFQYHIVTGVVRFVISWFRISIRTHCRRDGLFVNV